MVKYIFFVRKSSLYQCTAVNNTTLLLLIIAMACYGRQFFDFFQLLRVGKGYQDKILEKSDLSFSVRRAF
jgi:hypothetical protein